MAFRFVKSFNLGGGCRFVYSKRVGSGRKAASARKLTFWTFIGYCIIFPFLLYYWMFLGLYKLIKLGIKGIKKLITWIKEKRATSAQN